jgi:hypothetical protein
LTGFFREVQSGQREHRQLHIKLCSGRHFDILAISRL